MIIRITDKIRIRFVVSQTFSKRAHRIVYLFRIRLTSEHSILSLFLSPKEFNEAPKANSKDASSHTIEIDGLPENLSAPTSGAKTVPH